MENDSLEDLEQRLAAVPRYGVPNTLRATVLGDVHRELSAARWDRFLARAAAILLIVGVGMNVAIGVGPERERRQHLLAQPTQESLIRLAVNVAEATDAQTGRRYARHLATFAGRTLSGEEAAAIDAAIRRQIAPATFTHAHEG